MVSQDPVYVDFDPDEQSYLRYSANARRDRGNTLTVRVALAGEESFAHMGMVDFLDHQVNSAIVAGHILADTYALLRQCRRRAVGDHAVDEVPASRPPDAGSKRSCASSCAQESAAQICHMQLKSKHASLLVSPQKRLVQRRKC